MEPLIHIGYHKTGTTFLQKQVFPRPGFTLVAGAKRLHEAVVSVEPFAYDSATARSVLEAEVPDNLVPVLSYERLSGAPHRAGYDSDLIAERLVAAFPDARVLVVIREQMNMLVSLYKTYVRMGGVASFRQYVEPIAGDLELLPPFVFSYLEYHRLICRYSDLFGVNNVLVLPYELLEQRPFVFVKRVCEFSGARMPQNFAPRKRVNKSPSVLPLLLKRQANKWLIRSTYNQSPLLPLNLPNLPAKRLVGKLDRALPERIGSLREDSWRQFAARKVEGRYEKSNAATKDLTGIDLSRFGYAL